MIMPEFINEEGQFTDDFKTQLPDMLGDNYYNDPYTKHEPTKMFDEVKDFKTMVNNYDNAQRTISKGEAAFAEKTKGMVAIPNAESTPEQVKVYREAMGVPEKADGYKLTIPDGDDKESFTGIAAVVKEEALAAGAPPALLARIWDKVTATMTSQFKALEDKGLELIKADEDAMKAEHKENYDKYIKGTDAALAKLKVGVDIKKLFDNYGITNHPLVRKLEAEIAPFVMEGKTVLGDSAGGGNKESGFPSYEYDDNGRPI